MQHYFNEVQDRNGNAIRGALVSVFISGSSTLATLYSDNGITPKTNPISTDESGLFDFYAANAKYDISVSYQGKVLFTIDAIDLFDGAGVDQSLATVISTGSSASRALANRFAETANVRDFGALGDGATDDTSAFQAALNYAATNGIDVFIPKGNYYFPSASPSLDPGKGGLS